GNHGLVRTDSTSAVFHVSRLGGSQSLQSLREFQRLWTWVYPQLTSLRAMHLPGRRNSVEPCLSRLRLLYAFPPFPLILHTPHWVNSSTQRVLTGCLWWH
ncbi:hypothetical protein CRENBAI_011477, partial [Crenichthys baileyi]